VGVLDERTAWATASDKPRLGKLLSLRGRMRVELRPPKPRLRDRLGGNIAEPRPSADWAFREGDLCDSYVASIEVPAEGTCQVPVPRNAIFMSRPIYIYHQVQPPMPPDQQPRFVRVLISLDPNQYEWLRDLAFRRHSPMTKLIREAVDDYRTRQEPQLVLFEPEPPIR
jgi:hypothetical protein